MTTQSKRVCSSTYADFGSEVTLRCFLPRFHDGDHWTLVPGGPLPLVPRAWEDDNADLPTEPGFYVGDYDSKPSGKILIELLNSPEGQWVDNTDSRYLRPEWVRSLGNLTRLVPERVSKEPS